MRSIALLVTLAAACGGRYPTPAAPAAGAGASATGGDAGPRGVEAAALPYAIVDGRSGRAVAEDDFWKAAAAARLVCLGEDHTNPHHHWAQLTIVQRLVEARPSGLALGMEMVQRPFQAVLDDYRAGAIDEATMLSRVGWEDRWSYDFALYRPVIRAAVDGGAALLALNAARELTKKVVRHGLETLTAEERAQIAQEIVLDDAEHRAWFDAIMAEMGGAAHHSRAEPADEGEEAPAPPDDEHHAAIAAPSADRVYSVQVIWDETMAETAAAWAQQGERAVVVLAGNGHCHDSAIVRRAARRGLTPAISVRPIIDDGAGNVAAAIQEGRNDYLFVMSMPR